MIDFPKCLLLKWEMVYLSYFKVASVGRSRAGVLVYLADAEKWQ